VRGVQCFVFGFLTEAGAVIGEDHVAGQVAQAQSENVVVPHGVLDQSVEVGLLGRRDPIAEWSPIEDWLDGSLCDKACLGFSFCQPTLARLGSVAGAQQKAEEEDGHQQDAGVKRKKAGQRSLRPASVCHP
jgi:hypothetical protein